MCGRFAITLPPEAMRKMFAFEEHPEFPARYNIAPTQPIPIIRAERRNGTVGRHFALVRWAFLPSFAKDPASFPLLFNARSEGLGEKVSFRNALHRRRCLVPASAFYEWQRVGHRTTGASQAFVCRRTDNLPMALAGLWETWHGPNGEEVDTACIITTAANSVSAAIHPRLPALIDPDAFSTWLDPDECTTAAAVDLLRPAEADVLSFCPVGNAVNKVANDGPEVMRTIGSDPEAYAGTPPPEQMSLF